MSTVDRALGVCLGAENIKIVVLEAHDGHIRVALTAVREHLSDPRKVCENLLSETGPVQYGLVSGRSVQSGTDIPSIDEPRATEEALRFLRTERQYTTPYTALVSLGAETFIAYGLSSDGTIERVEAGSKCASGTGAFYRQQLGRMEVDIEEATSLAGQSEPHLVSGRCSVFCKSDCTHALNVGVPIGQITAGLCAMMADKVADLLVHLKTDNLLLCGGVARNEVIVEHLRRRFGSVTVPEHAEAFEALGAAYYALRNKISWERGRGALGERRHASFDSLPPLKDAGDRVRFETASKGKAKPGDTCIVGLDVGSTTTKAVVVRVEDSAVLASVYLRTNGDPVSASRRCYAGLREQLGITVNIVGLGVTGSGRQIAGLHAGTDCIINEIIAHATGAAFYDPQVDTIYEIGGQDAKYTYFVNGVPADYAMNEACSAGTGSFLEEAANESLGLVYTEIESTALKASHPPNFNDQCAAFIGSDIKTAIHDGLRREDIAAGLVYSICMNYVNRVRGQRPTGGKVFMQGGVCYNKAVPLAMATLIDRDIIVPPDPGMVGAFGVALELRERQEQGVLEQRRFDLDELAQREIEYGTPFECKGGKEKCDRRCQIARLRIEDKWYPFGGACNRYYNLVHHLRCDTAELDFVAQRQRAVHETFASSTPSKTGPRVGILRSYLTHTFYPLYSHFFAELGCTVVPSDHINGEGMRRAQSSLCFPAEIAHGSMADLLSKNPDYIFMPTVIELFVENGPEPRREHQSTCQILQAEPYYLKSAFKDQLAGRRLLTPAFDFSMGMDTQADVFAQLGKEMGYSETEARKAYKTAVEKQMRFERRLKEMGAANLKQL
ncbi:MAG: activase, partial [Chitinivibrionales bacterium]|nr:activase [Chitinivibrionales bacterium]MBD3358375.1 activase [Chitinivibrionales bacterium]